MNDDFCEHGTHWKETCKKCDREEAEMNALLAEERECIECGEEADRLADQHRARQDFNHFHPNGEE